MADNKKGNMKDEFPDSSDNASFSAEETDSNFQSEKDDSNIKGELQEKFIISPNIIVNVPENNDSAAINEARRANKYTKMGLKINTLLLFGTLAALGFTWWSTSITEKSVEIAQESLNNSRISDSIAEKRQIVIDSLDSIQRLRDYTRDTTNIKLAQKSLQAQINSINNAQQQFVMQNTPYLQLSDFKVSYDDIKETINLEPEMSNLGNYPAEIISHRFIIGFFDTVYSIANLDSLRHSFSFKSKRTHVGIIVSKEKSTPYPLRPEINPPTHFYNKIKSGEGRVFVRGEVAYVDYVTKRKRIYEYFCEVWQTPAMSFYTMRYSKNMDSE